LPSRLTAHGHLTELLRNHSDERQTPVESYQRDVARRQTNLGGEIQAPSPGLTKSQPYQVPALPASVDRSRYGQISSSGARLVQTPPPDSNIRSARPPSSWESPCSINREPKPRRLGIITGGPPASTQRS